MDRLHMFLVVLIGLVSYNHGWSITSVFEVTARPGDNISLYCDCKFLTGEYIVWNRNCSHENQPSLLFQTKYGSRGYPTVNASNYRYNLQQVFPRFQFVRNYSSGSYDLLITNITHSDEGLYYCAAEQQKVEDEKCITSKYEYRYGNTATRIVFNSSELHHHETPPDCSVCWMLLYSLCPASALLSSLLSSLMYHLYHKKAQELQVDQQQHETRGQTGPERDEDVCYAALEIRQASQRPKKMRKTQSSDFSTYSAINTSRM